MQIGNLSLARNILRGPIASFLKDRGDASGQESLRDRQQSTGGNQSVKALAAVAALAVLTALDPGHQLSQDVTSKRCLVVSLTVGMI